MQLEEGEKDALSEKGYPWLVHYAFHALRGFRYCPLSLVSLSLGEECGFEFSHEREDTWLTLPKCHVQYTEMLVHCLDKRFRTSSYCPPRAI